MAETLRQNPRSDWLPPVIVREADAAGKVRHGLGISFSALAVAGVVATSSLIDEGNHIYMTIRQHQLAVRAVDKMCNTWAVKQCQIANAVPSNVSAKSLTAFKAAEDVAVLYHRPGWAAVYLDFWLQPMTRQDRVREYEYLYRVDKDAYSSAKLDAQGHR